jgi:hypothetical protein
MGLPHRYLEFSITLTTLEEASRAASFAVQITCQPFPFDDKELHPELIDKYSELWWMQSWRGEKDPTRYSSQPHPQKKCLMFSLTNKKKILN